MNTVRSFKLLVIFALVSFLVACGGGPTKSDIETQVKEHLLSDGAGEMYDVLSVSKENGQKPSDSKYVADIAYRLKMKISIEDINKGFQEELRSNPLKIFENLGYMEAIKETFGSSFKVGDEKIFKRKASFAKTEKGWRLEALE